MSQNTSPAVMQQRIEPHDSLDDFPTPSWATRAVIEKIIEPEQPQIRLMTVREPCCNRGYMARPLAEYFSRVIATDIFDYGYAQHLATEDYLFPGIMRPAEWTFFNPPFRLGLEFVLHSFETPGWEGTACIVRTAFLEGGERYEALYKTRPPSIVAHHSERVIMTKGIVRDPAKEYWDEASQQMRRPSTATSYSWLIWKKFDPWNCTRTMWIPPCRPSMERPGDYPGGDDDGQRPQESTGQQQLI